MLLNPQPADLPADDEAAEGGRSADAYAASVEAAPHYLRQLEQYRGSTQGDLLEISAGCLGLPVEAVGIGYTVTRRRVEDGCASRQGPDSLIADLADASFDICVLAGVLDRVREPIELLRAAHRRLRAGGTLLIVTPSLDSPGRDTRGGFGAGRLTYFTPATLQTALHQTGYRGTIVEPARPSRSTPFAERVVGSRTIPRLRGAVRSRAGSVMVTMSSAVQLPARRTLSVIIPAFNEAATIQPLLESVLAKRVSGMEMEIVIVESHSTDGTREIVQRYATHPRVRLVLEDRPRGKGFAVRTGLDYATGDYILIQDADLEYDLEDYDTLLEPLASGREAFVLGARHGGNAWWKMRQFNRQRALSLFFNCGHWFFTTLVNVLFNQRLKDPFTMFKVFRRDCLFGLDFQCNRFDFDYELLIKLIRKGYRPVEIPVNYRSRSFTEGKKVSTFRDPLTWLRALAWLRFTRIDPLAHIERNRVALRQRVGATPTLVVPSRAAPPPSRARAA